MSRINYPGNSPYATTPQSSWAIGRFEFRPIMPDSGDTLYTLLPHHKYRPDLLSYELYGTAAYYWVFCVRNPALRAEPIWDFVPGLQIYVPSGGYIQSIVGN